MGNGIGYNDNARDYIKRNLTASRYIRRNAELAEAKASKVGLLGRLNKLLSFQNVLLLLLVVLVAFMVINAPVALDSMWEQQYNHKE